MDFLMDATGDLAIVNGDFALVSGVDETVQFLNQSLRLFLGEWFLDETRGIPYFDEIFIKNPNSVTVHSIFENHIVNLPGIEELQELDLDFDSSSRTLSITGRIRALDGEADFSVTNVIPGGNA